MRTRYLRNSFTATANGAAFIDIGRACKVRCLEVNITADMDAADDSYVVEISTVPFAQQSTNDAQGVIAIVGQQQAAAGDQAGGLNIAIPMEYDLEQGQRVYLSATLVGTDAVTVRAVLHCT